MSDVWLVEEGIGEERAILVENDRLVAARLRWHGELETGTVAEAKLIHRKAGSNRGVVSFPGGQQALLRRLPKDASEGASYRCRIVRPGMRERARQKPAQAELTDLPVTDAHSLVDLLQSEGHEAKRVRKFPASLWEDALTNALAGGWAFPGGSLVLFATPAMTLIDIDGELAPRELALASVQPVADAIRQLDIGGNIGIDFPTLQTKSERREVDEALARALEGWPHERTAMNGFGFVQIVARLEHISLLHRAQYERAALCARELLRQAEHLQGSGQAIELHASPAIIEKLSQDWVDELSRRTGKVVVTRPDAVLALEGGNAQLVPL